MPLKAIIDRLEDVEEAFRGLYVQKGDKWEIQIEGVKTQGDIDRVNAALTKEKKDHAAVKAELATAKQSLEAFGDLNAEDVHTKLAEYDTLKASHGQTPDAQRIAAMVQEQVAAKLKIEKGPLERKLAAAERERDELKNSVAEVTTKFNTKLIEDGLRSEAVKAGIVPAMIDDYVALHRGSFKLGDGDKPITEDGMDPAAFVVDTKAKKPYFWPTAQGADGRGSGAGGHSGPNPFSHEGWNLTQQGAMVNSNRVEAERLAKAAGTTIGGGRPAAPKKAAA